MLKPCEDFVGASDHRSSSSCALARTSERMCKHASAFERESVERAGMQDARESRTRQLAVQPQRSQHEQDIFLGACITHAFFKPLPAGEADCCSGLMALTSSSCRISPSPQ